MWVAFCDAAFRFLSLLALAIAPYAAPAEIAPSTGVRDAALRGAAFVLAFAWLAWAVREVGKRERLFAWSLAGTLATASVAAWALQGDAGPLARGAWYVSPLAFCTLGALATMLARKSRGWSRSAPAARAMPGILAAVACVASLNAAHARLTDRDTLWKQALAADPGNEAAAVAVASSLRQAGQRKAAYDVLTACRRARPDRCACDEEAAADAVDLGSYDAARAIVDAPTRCPRTARRLGVTAETLVGTSSTDEGVTPGLALEADPQEKHAAYALAWAAMLRDGSKPQTKKLAERAVQLGRGLSADLLLGLIDFQLGDVDTAATLFEKALTADPGSVQANYDAALVAQKRNRYHDAREGYLKAVRLDPSFADARYNLVGLTLGAGAIDESQHHLDQLVARHPSDPRIGPLREAIQRARTQARPSSLSP